MGAPPGISYLLRKVPPLLFPGLLAYATTHYVKRFTGISLPGWAVFLCVVLAKPLQFLVSTRYRRYLNEKEAQKLGAKMAPHVQESGLAIVSKLLEMFDRGYPGDTLQEWASKHGNIYETRLPTEGFIWTTEPEHVKAILATEFENFPKESLFIEQMVSLLGDGIFSVNGEKWKFHRAMTRPFFTRDRISDFDIFDTHASKALTLAKERLEAGYPVDFQDLVGRFTLDSASVFLFDEDLESLSAGLAYPFNCSKENASNHQYREHPSNLFADAFLDAITKGTRRTFWGQEWPLAEFWSDVVKPGREVIDRFAEKVINGRLKKGGGAEFEERDTLLEHLLNKTTDTRMIKDELFSMLVAGRDTTSCTLSYAMYNMTQHPEVVARLREEVMEYVGPTKRPTYDDIKGMKYIRAFINEVLRLYPPVPLNWRQPQKSTVFKTKDGPRYYIPAKTTVRYSVWAMHRRKDLWGPDADKFDPDRFLDERLKEYLIPNPFIFVPFNAGPRICLGQQFAYNEVSFFLIRLLQQFSEFELAQDAQDPQFAPPASWAQCEGTKGTDKVMPGANLTLYIKGGLWVRMK